jgi:(p)ppGpp synthase/HD superfamily hydrolase
VSTLERAITIAAEAHAGQVDKAGAPYVLHPLRMMLRMSSIDEHIVAALHDVCEDCPGWTFDRLRREGFSPLIIDALQWVTKRAMARGTKTLYDEQQPIRSAVALSSPICTTTATCLASPPPQSETFNASRNTDEQST